MTPYQRPKGSIDVKLDELPEGTHRVKIIGTIVGLNPTTVTVNDGSGTVILDLGKNSLENMELKKLGRFIADISKTDQKMYGNLVAWKEISKDIIEKYWEMVNIERRIPK